MVLLHWLRPRHIVLQLFEYNGIKKSEFWIITHYQRQQAAHKTADLGTLPRAPYSLNRAATNNISNQDMDSYLIASHEKSNYTNDLVLFTIRYCGLLSIVAQVTCAG